MTDAQETLVTRLRALLELLPPALDRHVASLGLTSYEFALLETVRRSPGERLRLSRLASSTNASLPRLSRVMNGLERKGLIARAPCAEDARATNAVLTPEGREVVDGARPVMNDALRELVLDPLDAGQERDFSAAMLAILRVLDPGGRLAVTAPPFCETGAADAVAGSDARDDAHAAAGSDATDAPRASAPAAAS